MIKQIAEELGLLGVRRALVGRRQRASVDALLRDAWVHGASGYREEQARAHLAARAARRRPLRDRGGTVRAVAFGLESWEQHGLWPSFEELVRPGFVNLGELGRRRGVVDVGPMQREILTDACLDHVDVLGEEAVSLVFFYVDTECLTPRLFNGLARRGIWSVLLGLDDKHRFAARREHGMLVGGETVAAHVDLMWTTWRAGADVVAQHGGQAWFAPPAADPSFCRPVEATRELDVVFVGRRYGERAALIDHLRAQGFGVHAYGRGWGRGHLSHEELLATTGRARVVLGTGGVSQMQEVQHLKGRDFEVPMCGAVYLTSYNPELADCFDIGREILCYSSPQNCCEVLHWILRDEAAQASIRYAARARALRDHTWCDRLEQLFALFPEGR